MKKAKIIRPYHFMQYTGLSKENLNLEFKTACERGELDTVRHLLTSPELKMHADITADNYSGFCWACYNGKLDVVRYLLTSPELKIHADIHADNDLALIFATMKKQLETVKYLLTSSELKEHADLHTNNDRCFILSLKPDLEITKFFIFDLNIEKSNHIATALKNNPNPQVEEWFRIRDFKNKLNKDLPSKNGVIKKNLKL